MDFLDQTIAVWQPYSEQPLTREDAREIAHNVMGFFQTLRQWADEEKRSAADKREADENKPTMEVRPSSSQRKTRKAKAKPKGRSVT